MKQVQLDTIKSSDLEQVLEFARRESVALVGSNGEIFVLKRIEPSKIAEDLEFEAEVETLRNSQKFQAFLDERIQYRSTKPIEALIEQQQ
jgi:hypothetical protein